MGRIPEEDVAKVREATDIASLVAESVQLKRKGRLLWGLCPFHGEKTASFKVDPSAQLWHCFGCGEGGDAFGFVMRTENVDFPEAVHILARRAGVEVREEGGEHASRRERLAAACEAAAEFYHKVLTGSADSAASAARDYLNGRGFGLDVAKRFHIGYAPGRGSLVAHLREAGFSAEEMAAADLAHAHGGGVRDRFFERVMFPIYDLRGRCVGFGGRVMGDGNPKYLNTGETALFHKSANMYAVNWAKNEIVRAGEAIVVEGYTDVIALHEAGLGNAVATLGTALTEQHTRMLARFASRVVYLFDGDEAGRRAADRAAEMADWRALGETGQGVELAVALLPQGDPADFVEAHGAEEMREVVSSAVPLARYAIDRALERQDLATPEGRARGLASAAAFLAGLGETLLAQDYAGYVADRLMTDYETVRLAVRKARPQGRTAAAAHAMAGAARQPIGESERAGCEPPRPETPQERAERELVRLAALVPRLRAEARELLPSAVLTSARYRAVLERVIGTGAAERGDLYAAVREQDSEAAAVLTGLLVDAQVPSRPEVAFEELLTKLKEYELERLIVEGKSEMRMAEESGDRARGDGLFRDISALTLRLERLRRGATGGDERD